MLKIFMLLVGAFLPAAPAQDQATPRAVFDKYCLTCHSEKTKTAGIDLQSLDTSKPGANAELVEKVIAKLRAGSMPPPGARFGRGRTGFSCWSA